MKIKAMVGTVCFTLKKYSPEILLAVGITGAVGSAVLACKATLSAEEILDEHERRSGRIDDCVALRETSEVDYSVSAEKNDRRELMAATVGKFIRLYGPSVTLMAASVGCILGSYRIMKTRQVALMAAYKVVEEAFTKYRQRVKAKYGEAIESELYYGMSDSGETRTVTDKDGKEVEQNIIDCVPSGFARFFGPERPDQMGSWTGSTQWSKVHEYNLDFLAGKEKHFDNMLASKGFVTINDVYSELGFPTTEAGMVCGWRYKSDRGDGYISFSPRGGDRSWLLGRDGDEILLDFNIDGVIFDQGRAKKELR